MFLLAAGFPTDWFFVAEPGVTDPPSLGLAAGVFTILFLFVIALSDPHIYLNAIARLPYLSAFLVLLAISSLWSYQIVLSGRRALGVVLSAAYAIWLCYRFDRDERFAIISVPIAFSALLSLVFALALPQWGVNEQGAWDGIYDNRNALAHDSVLALLVLLIAARHFRRFRVFFYASAGSAAAATWFATSATGRAGGGAILALLLVYQAFRARKQLFGAAVTALAGATVLAGMVATASLGWITTRLGRDITLSGRLPLWELSWDAFMARPWFGYGWEGFWGGYFSPAHSIWIATDWEPPNAHNLLLDLGIQTGIFGALLFVIAWMRGFRRSVFHVRDVKGPLGLFPILMLSFVPLFGTTESGLVGRTQSFVLVVVALASAADQSLLSREG